MERVSLRLITWSAPSCRGALTSRESDVAEIDISCIRKQLRSAGVLVHTIRRVGYTLSARAT